MPDRAPLSQLHPHPHLLVRWFVQYNPTFTASALSVLGGVLLIARARGAGSELLLTGVLELYQLLVIGTAALLSRRLQDHRPAAILGVIALVFLADPTLQVSALAASDLPLACLAWVGMFAGKLALLAWAFQLEVNWSARVLAIGGALLVAALPNTRVLGVGTDHVPGGIAAAVLALGLVAVLAAPRVRCRRALGEAGTVMLPRLLRAAAAIAMAGVAFQAWNATLALGAGALVPAAAAAAFVAALGVRREAAVWTLVALGLWLARAADLDWATCLLLAAGALLVAGRRFAPRVRVGGVLAIGAAAIITAWPLLPSGAGPWGAALVVAGFVLLPAGVVLHRRLSAALAQHERAREPLDAAGPATSAAIGARA